MTWIDTCPLIDIHTHAGSEKRGESPARTVAEIIRLQRSEQLNYGILLSREFSEPIDHRAFLTEIAAHKKQCGGLLRVTPHQSDAHLRCIRPLIQEFPESVLGFKLHPARDNYTVNLNTVDDICACAVEYNLMIGTHTSVKSPACDWLPLLEKYPTLRLLLYHAHHPDDICELLSDFPHTRIDTSGDAFNPDTLIRVAHTCGHDRICFGIDGPLAFPHAHGHFLPHYRQAAKEIAGFCSNDRNLLEQIFFKNAEAFLGKICI